MNEETAMSYGMPEGLALPPIEGDCSKVFVKGKMIKLKAANDLLREEKRKIVNALWHCTDAATLATIKKLLGLLC